MAIGVISQTLDNKVSGKKNSPKKKKKREAMEKEGLKEMWQENSGGKNAIYF